jgi:type 1 glutamine amidotransferase
MFGDNVITSQMLFVQKPMKPILLSVLTAAALAGASAAHGADKKIVFVAGSPSHGHGEHEHRAGCLLLAKCLNQVPGITSVVYSNGWPRQADAFEGADAIVIYSDGGDGHPAIAPEHLKQLGELMNKGVGLGCIHYAVELPKEKGGPEFLKWIGGYFETYWSVNPTWEASFKSLPDSPISRGVNPFQIRDEWFYHMRFPEGMKNVTPILTAVPPDSTRGQPGANDAHGGNPEVQKHKGEPEHTMWAIERPDGGRGFGFTGGHYHKNWGNDDFRKLVLNAILWSAKAEVPANGVECQVSAEDLKQNLDRK